jgi:hypothetical protein
MDIVVFLSWRLKAFTTAKVAPERMNRCCMRLSGGVFFSPE